MSLDQQPDFLEVKNNLDLNPYRKRPIIWLGRLFFVALIACGVAGVIFSYQVTTSSDGTGNFPKLAIFSTIKQLVHTDQLLKGEAEDRINILLMGVGGAGHDGPQLSDTMILASYKPSTKDIGLISVPRDLYVPIPGYGWRKINHANAYGEIEAVGTGPDLATKVVEDVFKQPIHYYIRVDFDGFAELIDELGGLDINVENAFTDPTYPTVGKEDADCGTFTESTNEEGEVIAVPDYSCRFEVLRFKEGPMHMDGTTALKYVRSRHGTNGEGSDFARSRRQQLILLAVRERVLSASTLLNPAKMSRILDTLRENIATNVETPEMVKFAQIAKEANTDTLKNHVLDTSNESPLYATNRNGAYVLLPKNDDWSSLERISTNIFLDSPLDAPYTKSVAKNTTENTKNTEASKPILVEIQNGTSVSGLAYRTSQIIDGQGFSVRRVGNADTKGYEETFIYDFTNGKYPQELKVLSEYLGAELILSPAGWRATGGKAIPAELIVKQTDFSNLANDTDVDFLVILGQNSSEIIR